MASWDVTVQHEPSGVIRASPNLGLGPYPVKLTDALDLWAQTVPDRLFIACRDATSEWSCLTYGRFRTQARNSAQWLLGARLSADRPIVILSGNDLEHAILGIAAMYAGIPYAPVSPSYSLALRDFAKLRHVFELLNPGLVFASDGDVFSDAIENVVKESTPVMVTRNPQPRAVPFDTLTAMRADEAVDRATAVVTGDTVAKILFTSGSTGLPKGVVNTQRMLCSNQEMLRTVFAFFRDTPPVICDWLPWNHTFGGNHNFGFVLYNGGTLYIDGGKPFGPAFQETVRNIREIAPTIYFNVPRGFESLVDVLRNDRFLREHFFSRLAMNFYAGAALSQPVWDALDDLAIEACGYRIPMLTGLGATETAPFALCVSQYTARAGVVGLPVPGVELKLAPAGNKLEACLRGPNVTPGFWRQPGLTRAAFDDEGYYHLGDALRFLDPNDETKGFVFDGRIAEDFKLSTGTWVSVGPLRARFLLHAAPYIRDIVFAGHNRDELTALLFPEPAHWPDFETLRGILHTFAAQSTCTSSRIARAVLLDNPPSIDAGEITDKGSINQQVVLELRAAVVDRLYTIPVPSDVINAA